MKALSRDSFIVDYMKDCLRSVRPDKMGWLAAESCKDNIKPLQVMEYKTLSPAELLDEKITLAVLGLVHRLYKLSASPDYEDCAKVRSSLRVRRTAPTNRFVLPFSSSVCSSTRCQRSLTWDTRDSENRQSAYFSYPTYRTTLKPVRRIRGTSTNSLCRTLTARE